MPRGGLISPGQLAVPGAYRIRSLPVRTLLWVLIPLVLIAVAAGAWRWKSGARGTLEPVAEFGANPTGLLMHLYLPPDPSPRPAAVLALHWCQGSGPDLHHAAGLSRLADRYGFVVIYPSVTRASRCWDVSSTAALTHDGGSDPRGLLSMIQYVIDGHGVDADRVFVTGHSSGGMMTQVMLGAHPQRFRAGAAMAGVPFACFEGPGDWSEACARGEITRSAREWGDRVRAAQPDFEGSRPPLQLWHGTEDDALSFHNHGEAIKQWTDVLGLQAEPVSSRAGVPQGRWTQLRFADAEGRVLLEAYRGDGEPHNFAYPAPDVVRFFGLDHRQR